MREKILRKKSTKPTAIIFAVVLALASTAPAGDWPMWRYDAGRRAYTPHALPAGLHLQWVRELPKPKGAWPWNQYKQQFDASYEPVVKGKLLFVPSMVRDSVTAYDTETGREKWRFYADAPVRFAPAAWKDKLFVASDDGHLYCLGARTGTLLWKFRGAPLTNRVLANGRLSSMYPVRGAPVVRDGVVYFSAGVWPFLGTFIHALDAETGKVVWSNSGSGPIYILQPHASPAFAGVGPQGYMVATKTHLIVPGGRAVPAGYDRKTGRFLWHHANTKAGDFGVWGNDQIFWNDGRIAQVGNGKEITRTGATVVMDKVAIGAHRGKVTAHSYSYDYRKKRYADAWSADSGGAIARVHLVAGDRLYGANGGTVAAMDVNTRKVVWRGKVEGKVWNMLAADDKLFVVTREGRIYCFSGRKVTPKTYPYRPKPPAPQQRDAGERGTLQALIKAGGTEGYAVVLGVETGGVIDELARQTKLDLIVLEPDAKKAQAARRRYDAAGWYGQRVHIVVGCLDSPKLPPRPDTIKVKLPPYLANLITSEDPYTAGLGQDGAITKAFQVLRPYGGALCIFQDRQTTEALKRRIESLKLPGARVTTGPHEAGMRICLRREGALPGSADWSHQYGDISNSVFSPDKRVKAPLGMLWFGGPSNMDVLPRHGHGPTPQVAAGRLIIEGIGVFQARDVYTGRTIWKRKFPKLNTFDMYYTRTYNPDPYDRSYNQTHYPGANWFGSNHVTTADKVYLVSQTICHVLDAATGKTVKELKLPAEKGRPQANWGFIGVTGDLLIATARPVQVPSERGPDPKTMRKIIPQHAPWHYLAGRHPKGNWQKVDYRAAGWKVGQAGFGYGDGDDRTVLNDMRGKYGSVYCRKTFTIDDPKKYPTLYLAIRFDDGFIAYLNGKEVVRSHVGQGAGAAAKGIKGHEVDKNKKNYDYFEITNAAALLRKGLNVFALEGHNTQPGSSDFSLDPFVLAPKDPGKAGASGKQIYEVPGVRANHRFAPESRMLVVMDRHTGKVIWTRKAQYAFRHNTVVAGGGKLFCLDRLRQAQIGYLAHRGVKFNRKPTLYALDLQTGREIWKSDGNVFGTWLGYSAEHDVLLQGGSRAGDRGYDEAAAGMVAYKARTGKVLWRREDRYTGPPVIHHDKILTQTGGANRSAPPAPVYHLLTGKIVTRKHPLTGQTIPWTWVRFKGCNTAVASEHLLTFRSASAAFVPLDVSQGTASIGGFKSGCTSNLIVANGVLNAPDYTRTCTCAYQQQSSLAMVHMPELEYWSFDHFPPPSAPTPVKRVGINFGAPGNRTADDGTLWMEFPSAGGPSPDLPVWVTGDGAGWFRGHNTTVEGELNWVAASGVQGPTRVTVRPFLQPEKYSGVVMGYWYNAEGRTRKWGAVGGRFDKPRAYTVRLHFSEPENLKAGERIFSVSIQGKQLLRNFDIVKAAGGANRAVAREFKGVRITDNLELSFTASRGKALLCGIELVAE